LKTLVTAAVIVLLGCVWLVIFSHNIHARYDAMHTHYVETRDNTGALVCGENGRFVSIQEFHRLHPDEGCWVPVTGVIHDGTK
jgi:hypothetical protein